MPTRTWSVRVSVAQQAILKEWVEVRSTPRGLAQRAAIVLGCAGGVSDGVVAERVQVHAHTVALWRKRWAQGYEALLAAERQGASDKDLSALVRAILSDLPRPGTPARFTAEQLTNIIAVACERPQDCGLPLSQWSAPVLTHEVMKRGIVDSISPRHLSRFLKGGRCAAAQVTLLAHVAGQERRPASLPGGCRGTV